MTPPIPRPRCRRRRRTTPRRSRNGTLHGGPGRGLLHQEGRQRQLVDATPARSHRSRPPVLPRHQRRRWLPVRALARQPQRPGLQRAEPARQQRTARDAEGFHLPTQDWTPTVRPPSTAAPSWSVARLSSRHQMPNYEMFGDRRVPFHGDYNYVSSVGNFAFSTWTDTRQVRRRRRPAVCRWRRVRRQAVPDAARRRHLRPGHLPQRRRSRPGHLRHVVHPLSAANRGQPGLAARLTTVVGGLSRVRAGARGGRAARARSRHRSAATGTSAPASSRRACRRPAA